MANYKSYRLMNRLTDLFERKEKDILNIYFTAGYPKLEDTLIILKKLEETGVDMVEIGMPYSDPLADGATIQQTSQVALQNGMTLDRLFEQLSKMRQTVQLPVVLMGYFNQVLQYGEERFFERCAQVGIDGLILPDLPLREYELKYKSLFEAYNLKATFLMTPQTSPQRVKKITQLSSAFIYAVSSSSTTGKQTGFQTKQLDYFKQVQTIRNTGNSVLIGFGISNQETYEQACEYASGAIIGSAFLRALANGDDLETSIENFIQSIRPISVPTI